MATPSAGRPHSGSTPKNTSIATPASIMPSPRPPTSAPMGRNLSQKSLASKTPASGPAQSHSVGTSSHPSNTPLLAPALVGEESLNFSSPAAIMMSSLASHSLTPLPSGPDGIAISGDLNHASSGQESVMGSRNPEEERLRRLQVVLKLLSTRVAGRGICREGVERLAQQAGLTHMWQDDTLAIAGTCVDLEIAFDSVEKDKAMDVVLKIFTPEYEDDKKEASEVLKADLDSSRRSGLEAPWRSLEGFASNLAHLGKMDNLSQGMNCFEAIEGLFLTFRRIWTGEEKAGHHRRMLDRLSRGAVGRPSLNRKRKLGLGIDYWSERRQVPVTASTQGNEDRIQLDSSSMESNLDENPEALWTVRIDCEPGYPSLRVSKDWVAENIFLETTNEENDRLCPQIAWTEPAPTLVPPAEGTNQPDGVNPDENEVKIPQPPEVRFVANLEPAVLVPLSVASSVLNKQGLSLVLDDSKITTFEKALCSLAAQPTPSENSGIVQPPPKSMKSVIICDENGLPLSRRHLYRLYSTPPIWCCPLQSVVFDHPKHLAELLPTLRQYALLWTLLRSIISPQPPAATTGTGDTTSGLASVTSRDPQNPPNRWNIKKSNTDPRRAKVKSLLKGGMSGYIAPKTSASDPGSAEQQAAALPVDISVGMTSATPARPKLDLIWPLPITAKAQAASRIPRFGGVCIEVGLNGEVYVPSATGLPSGASEQWLKAITRVVALSEDLGLLVEWLLEKLYVQKG